MRTRDSVVIIAFPNEMNILLRTSPSEIRTIDVAFRTSRRVTTSSTSTQFRVGVGTIGRDPGWTKRRESKTAADRNILPAAFHFSIIIAVNQSHERWCNVPNCRGCYSGIFYVTVVLRARKITVRNGSTEQFFHRKLEPSTPSLLVAVLRWVLN